LVLQKEKGNLKIGKIIVKVPGNVKEAFASVDEAIEKLMEINKRRFEILVFQNNL